jgi:hypothetical protein
VKFARYVAGHFTAGGQVTRSQGERTRAHKSVDGQHTGIRRAAGRAKRGQLTLLTAKRERRVAHLAPLWVLVAAEGHHDLA